MPRSLAAELMRQLDHQSGWNRREFAEGTKPLGAATGRRLGSAASTRTTPTWARRTSKLLSTAATTSRTTRHV